MKDKLIKNYFEILGSKKENEKKFCILENKKSGRTIIFQKGSKDAIRFMKNKSSSTIKKLGYFLIKFNILQIFLKKIKLDPSVGQLIFFGGQTKIFDFNEKKVISFLRGNWGEKVFVENKKDQEILAKKGYAPKILKLNKKIPFCVEELLKEGVSIKEEDIFKKLLKYYETQKIKKISYFSYISKLEKKSDFEELSLPIKKELENIKNKKNYFYVSDVHGDFAREQVLVKDNKIVFTDWDIRKDLILADLFNFFKEKENPIKEYRFQYLLKMFPEKISKNVKDYFLVNQANLFLASLIPYYARIKRRKPLFLTPNK